MRAAGRQTNFMLLRENTINLGTILSPFQRTFEVTDEHSQEHTFTAPPIEGEQGL
jgi:hypothetical protein